MEGKIPTLTFDDVPPLENPLAGLGEALKEAASSSGHVEGGDSTLNLLTASSSSALKSKLTSVLGGDKLEALDGATNLLESAGVHLPEPEFPLCSSTSSSVLLPPAPQADLINLGLTPIAIAGNKLGSLSIPTGPTGVLEAAGMDVQMPTETTPLLSGIKGAGKLDPVTALGIPSEALSSEGLKAVLYARLESFKDQAKDRLISEAKTRFGIDLGGDEEGGDENEETKLVVMIWEESKVVVFKGVVENCSSLLATVQSIVPVISLGHLSLSSLAATTLGTLVVNLTGTTVLEGLAGVYGEVLPKESGENDDRDKEVAEWTWRMGVLMIGLTVPISILYNSASSVFLALNPNQDKEVVELASKYLSWYSFGLPAYALTLLIPPFLTSHNLGHIHTRIIGLTTSLSLFLNWLFVHSPPEVSLNLAEPISIPYINITLNIGSIIAKINSTLEKFMLPWRVNIDLDFGTFKNPFNLGFVGAPVAAVLTYYAIAFLSVGYILFKMDIRKWPRPFIPGASTVVGGMETIGSIAAAQAAKLEDLKVKTTPAFSRSASDQTLVGEPSSSSTPASPTSPSSFKGKEKGSPTYFSRTLSSTSTLVSSPISPTSLKGKAKELSFSSFDPQELESNGTTVYANEEETGIVGGIGSAVGGMVGEVGSVAGEVGGVMGGVVGGVGNMGLETVNEAKEEVERYLMLVKRGVSSVVHSSTLLWPQNLPTLSLTLLGPVAMGAQSVLLASASVLLNITGKGIEGVLTKRLDRFIANKKPRRAKVVTWLGITSILAMSYFVLWIVVKEKERWSGAWTNDVDVSSLVMVLLPLLCVLNIFDSMVHITGEILRKTGDSKFASLANASAFYAIGLPLGLFLAFAPKYRFGLWGLWAGNATSLIWSATVGVWMCTRLDWGKVVRGNTNGRASDGEAVGAACGDDKNGRKTCDSD